MINKIDEFVKEKVAERSIEAVNNIASADEHYRQLSKELDNYGLEIERQISAQAFELFSHYQELFLSGRLLLLI